MFKGEYSTRVPVRQTSILLTIHANVFDANDAIVPQYGKWIICREDEAAVILAGASANVNVRYGRVIE